VKYRLVEEEDEWRIQSMIDEGADAQRLSTAELERRMTTLFERVQALTEEINASVDELDEDELDEDEDGGDDLDIEDVEDELEEIVCFTKRALHYSDALIAQSPNNAAYYQRAASQAITIPDWERAVIYLGAIAQRFPDQRGETTSVLVIVLTSLAAEYEEEGLHERAEHFIEVIEKTLRDSVATDNNFMSNILLATMLISREEDLDEAESLLHQSQAMASEPREQAQVENGLAKLADARGQVEVALTHYQRTVELDPEAPDIWFNIGSAQKELHQNDEAIQSFLRAIEADLEAPEAYVELSRIYMEQGQLARAREILDEGMDTIPDAADLYAARAMVYIMEGNLRDADDLLTEAEMIDPDLEIVQEARQLFNVRKAQRQSFKPKSGKHKPKKR
jgi:tetratricopeptide (TPR) repeat protein